MSIAKHCGIATPGLGWLLMLYGVHLLTGAAIGAVVPDLTPASGLAVLSHYAIDHLPHWNYLPRYKSKWEDTWKMALEPLITIPLFILLAWIFHWGAEILIPAFVATLPDIIEGLQFFLKSRILKYHSRLHHFGHWHVRFWQGLPILLSLLVVLALALPLKP